MRPRFGYEAAVLYNGEMDQDEEPIDEDRGDDAMRLQLQRYDNECLDDELMREPPERNEK